MDWISNIVDSVLKSINRTFHKTTCSSECCNHRDDCQNEGESSSDEIEVPTHRRDQETRTIFTTKLEVRRLSQTSINPPPPSLASETD